MGSQSASGTFSKSDSLAGVDLDDSLDEQGDVKVWARGIVERFGDTYMETSPSGQGLKIWTRGSLPANLAVYRWGTAQLNCTTTRATLR